MNNPVLLDESRRTIMEYEFGVNRYLKTVVGENYQAVIICEKFTRKHIGLSLTQWANLKLATCLIGVHIALIKEKPEGHEVIKYSMHLGSCLFVNISEGFPCVDIRYFYMNNRLNKIMPEQRGFTIHLGEWADFKEAIDTICRDTPIMRRAGPCMHEDSDDGLKCWSCNPFRVKSTTAARSIYWHRSA